MINNFIKKIKKNLGKKIAFTTENIKEGMINIFDGQLALMAFDQGFSDNRNHVNQV